MIRALAVAHNIDVADVTDEDIAAAVADALAPARPRRTSAARSCAAWDPVELLVPEWRYLQKPALFPQQQNSSGLMVTESRARPELPHAHHRVSSPSTR